MDGRKHGNCVSILTLQENDLRNNEKEITDLFTEWSNSLTEQFPQLWFLLHKSTSNQHSIQHSIQVCFYITNRNKFSKKFSPILAILLRENNPQSSNFTSCLKKTKIFSTLDLTEISQFLFNPISQTVSALYSDKDLSEFTNKGCEGFRSLLKAFIDGNLVFKEPPTQPHTRGLKREHTNSDPENDQTELQESNNVPNSVYFEHFGLHNLSKIEKGRYTKFQVNKEMRVERERESERQTDRKTDRQTDRQTMIQAEETTLNISFYSDYYKHSQKVSSYIDQ